MKNILNITRLQNKMFEIIFLNLNIKLGVDCK